MKGWPSSAHFSRQELACRCCGRLEVDSRLVEGLEALRALAGVPVIVHAGYRCERHNAEVGGVPHSEHTRGLAADIHLQGLSLQRMYELALEVPQFAQGGIGVMTAVSCIWTCAITGRAGRG